VIHKVTQGKTNTDGHEQCQAAQTLTRQELMIRNVCVLQWVSDWPAQRQEVSSERWRDGV